MMKILITGFEPFGGERENPAWRAVELLPAVICGAKIKKLCLPTAFGLCGDLLEKAMREELPDAVICVGQAGGRSHMSVEQVAINLIEARIAGNEGNQPQGVPVACDGETAYFSTLPVKAMVKRMADAGIPAAVSYTAGTFVCNELMYRLLHFCATSCPHVRGGFVHVPYSTEQAAQKNTGTASMSVELIAKGLELAISAVVEVESDEALAGAAEAGIYGETH